MNALKDCHPSSFVLVNRKKGHWPADTHAQHTSTTAHVSTTPPCLAEYTGQPAGQSPKLQALMRWLDSKGLQPYSTSSCMDVSAVSPALGLGLGLNSYIGRPFVTAPDIGDVWVEVGACMLAWCKPAGSGWGSAQGCAAPDQFPMQLHACMTAQPCPQLCINPLVAHP